MLDFRATNKRIFDPKISSDLEDHLEALLAHARRSGHTDEDADGDDLL